MVRTGSSVLLSYGTCSNCTVVYSTGYPSTGGSIKQRRSHHRTVYRYVPVVPYDTRRCQGKNRIRRYFSQYFVSDTSTDTDRPLKKDKDDTFHPQRCVAIPCCIVCTFFYCVSFGPIGTMPSKCWKIFVVYNESSVLCDCAHAGSNVPCLQICCFFFVTLLTSIQSAVKSSTARYGLLTVEETNAILEKSTNCAEGECSVEDVDSLLKDLEEQRQILNERLVEVTNMIDSLNKANTAKDRPVDEVRETVGAIARLFVMGDKASGNDYSKLSKEDRTCAASFTQKKWEYLLEN